MTTSPADQASIEALRDRARADTSPLPTVDYPAAVKKPPVARCNSCSAPIWWGLTAKGKRCPFNYDLVTASPTQVSHFTTCPQAKTWSKR